MLRIQRSYNHIQHEQIWNYNYILDMLITHFIIQSQNISTNYIEGKLILSHKT